MSDLLIKLATYLATKLELQTGKDVFYNELPDKPNKAVLLQELEIDSMVPPQINAAKHRIRVSTRDTSNDLAKALADACYRWLTSDNDEYDDNIEADNTTGFIQLDETDSVFVQLRGNPIWDKADQQGRKYFCFTALFITKR